LGDIGRLIVRGGRGVRPGFSQQTDPPNKNCFIELTAASLYHPPCVFLEGVYGAMHSHDASLLEIGERSGPLKMPGCALALHVK